MSKSVVKHYSESKVCPRNIIVKVYPSIELVKNRGFKSGELRKIETAIEKYRELIIDNWNEFHGEE